MASEGSHSVAKLIEENDAANAKIKQLTGELAKEAEYQMEERRRYNELIRHLEEQVESMHMSNARETQYLNNISNLKAELGDTQVKFAKSSGKEKELTKSTGDYEAKINHLSDELRKEQEYSRSESERLQNVNYTLKSELEEIQSSVGRYKTEQGAEMQALMAEMDKVNRERSKLTAQLQEARLSQNAMKAHLSSLPPNVEDVLKDSKEKMANFETELDKQGKFYMKRIKELEKLLEEKDNLNRDILEREAEAKRFLENVMKPPKVEELEDVQGYIITLNQSMAKLERNRRETSEKLADTELQLKSATSMAVSLEQKVRETERENSRQAVHLENEISKMRESLAEAEQTKALMKDQIDRLNAKLDQTASELQRHPQQHHSGLENPEASGAMVRIASLESELKKQATHSSREAAAMKKTIGNLEAEVRAQQERRQTLEAQNDELTTRLREMANALKSSGSGGSEHADSKVRLLENELTIQAKHSSEEIADLKERYNTLQHSFRELQKSASSQVHETREDFSHESHLLRTELTEAKQRIRELHSENVDGANQIDAFRRELQAMQSHGEKESQMYKEQIDHLQYALQEHPKREVRELQEFFHSQVGHLTEQVVQLGKDCQGYQNMIARLEGALKDERKHASDAHKHARDLERELSVQTKFAQSETGSLSKHNGMLQEEKLALQRELNNAREEVDLAKRAARDDSLALQQQVDELSKPDMLDAARDKITMLTTELEGQEIYYKNEIDIQCSQLERELTLKFEREIQSAKAQTARETADATRKQVKAQFEDEIRQEYEKEIRSQHIIFSQRLGIQPSEWEKGDPEKVAQLTDHIGKLTERVKFLEAETGRYSEQLKVLGYDKQAQIQMGLQSATQISSVPTGSTEIKALVSRLQHARSAEKAVKGLLQAVQHETDGDMNAAMIASIGATRHLVKVVEMAMTSNNHQLVVNSVDLLSTLSEEEVVKEELVAYNAIHTISLCLLQAANEDPRPFALHILANLSSFESAKPHLLSETDLLKPLLGLAEHGDIDQSADAMRLIYLFSTDDQNGSFLQENGLALLSKAVEQPSPSKAGVLKLQNAMLAVRQLSRHAGVRVKLRDTSILEQSIANLSHQDEILQRESVETLGNLSVNAKNKITIRTLGGIKPLVALMTSSNEEIQLATFRTVANLAMNDENKIAFMDYNWEGPAYQAAMDATDSRINLQLHAYRIFGLMSAVKETHESVAQLLPVLIDRLEHNNVDLAVEAARTIELSAREDDLLECFHEVMMKQHLVKPYTTNLVVESHDRRNPRMWTSITVVTLLSASEQCRRQISTNKEVVRVVLGYVDLREEEKLRKAGIGLLVNLCKDEMFVSKLKQINGFSVILECLSDPILRIPALEVCHILAEDEHLHPTLVKCGTIQKISDLIGEDESITIPALKALSQFVVSVNETDDYDYMTQHENKTAVASASGLMVKVVSAIERGSLDLKRLATYFAYEISDADTAAIRFRQAGGIPVVLMGLESGDLELKAYSLNVSCNLLKAAPTKKEIQEAIYPKYMTAVVDGVATPDSLVAEAGVLALYYLMENGFILEVLQKNQRVLSVLLSHLRAFSVAVRRYSLACLRGMCADENARPPIFDAFPLIVRCSKDTNAEVKGQADALLGALKFYDEARFSSEMARSKKAQDTISKAGLVSRAVGRFRSPLNKKKQAL